MDNADRDFDYWWFLEGNYHVVGNREFDENDMKRVAKDAYEFAIVSSIKDRAEKAKESLDNAKK